MTKQDITKSVAICTDSVETFWDISLNATDEYTAINVCHVNNPSNFPSGITIHKGYGGEKDWRICGADWKKLYSNDNPEIGDIMLVRKLEYRRFSVEIIKKDSPNYAFLNALFSSNDNYVMLTTGNSDKFNFFDKDRPLQQIFYGAPGTGKSHEINRLTQGCDVIRTTFHPDCDYSTFVGCYKPIMGNPKPIYGFDATGMTVKVEDPKGTIVKERGIEYKFVKQAFLKAYIEAWKKMSGISLTTAASSAIIPASTSTPPYSTTGIKGTNSDFVFTSSATLIEDEIELLLKVDNFDFPFKGIENFAELHKKITVVVTNEPNDEQKKRYIKEITLTAEQIRNIYAKWKENYSFEGLLGNIVSKLRVSSFSDLENYNGEAVTIEINNSHSLLGLYDPNSKTVYLFKNKIGNNPSLLCAVYVHEMFHAYYDSGKQYIQEVEEPIVECNTLCFLELFNTKICESYLEDVESKKRSSGICHYGFGAYLFENRSLDWMNLYHKGFNSINENSTIVNIYKNKFFPIYPLGEEQETMNLLYGILNTQCKAGFDKSAQFLIIEEINRGNCAQIFGDLFQLLDREKGFSEYPIEADDDLRNELEKEFVGFKLSTDITNYINSIYTENYPTGITDKILKGELLVLPNNLYIWATMNTSDQSLFPMDSAFKRRWNWECVPIQYNEPISSQYTITIGNEKYNWVDFLKNVNEKIKKVTSSEDKQMGNFFIKGNIDEKTFINKVMFYLWNDVCKESWGCSDNFFIQETDYSPEVEFSFNDLFGEKKVVTTLLQNFMEKSLGLTPLPNGTSHNPAQQVQQGTIGI